MVISRSVLLRTKNVSDKSCRENQNPHFMFNNFFFFRKSCRLLNNVEKYGKAGQVTYDDMILGMRIACWMPKATNTHSEYVIIPAAHGKCGYANAPHIYVYT